jgi:hypothetical protein
MGSSAPRYVRYSTAHCTCSCHVAADCTALNDCSSHMAAATSLLRVSALPQSNSNPIACDVYRRSFRLLVER